VATPDLDSRVSREDFSLYILSCADGSLYTGISTDVQSRLAQHERGTRGAKYLRGRAPFSLVFEQRVGDRSAAQRLEYQVKKLSRDQKKQLIAGRLTLDAIA